MNTFTYFKPFLLGETYFFYKLLIVKCLVVLVALVFQELYSRLLLLYSFLGVQGYHFQEMLDLLNKITKKLSNEENRELVLTKVKP